MMASMHKLTGVCVSRHLLYESPPEQLVKKMGMKPTTSPHTATASHWCGRLAGGNGCSPLAATQPAACIAAMYPNVMAVPIVQPGPA